MGAIKSYTDISGHLIASPSAGIFVPGDLLHPPLVASLAFPRVFLNGTDEEGRRVYCKTTALEALAILACLLLDPLRYAEGEALFFCDNSATVRAVKKGFSKEPWVSSIARAVRVLSAGIGCELHIDWERRRSSRPSQIADNLTHNSLEGLSHAEVEAYLSKGEVFFPFPLRRWMARPGGDHTLGARCLSWARARFPELAFLRPSYM